jgi:glycosyltransferase involved in cell wall biosynthesis
LTVLAVHPSSVAASRLRAVQYAPHLESAGVSVTYWSFLREQDLPAWFGRSQLRRLWVLAVAFLRLPSVVRAVSTSSIVLVQREALPLGPPIVERLAARGRKLVWDVDDAIWQPFASPTAGRVPQWVRGTGGKYPWLCRRADEVWAGSEVLADWCRQHSARVHVVPTVVPVPRARPNAATGRTVGWIGSHSTRAFVEAILPALRDVEPTPKVIVVGASPTVPDELHVERLPWSPAVEADALARTRVGLYPIDREHPLAEGKCGLKAVLYMAHGIPPVVTPTTTNSAVVRDGVDGFHAESDSDWTARVQVLLDDEELWNRLSASAHLRALELFSLEVWAPRVVARINALGTGT